MIGPGWLPRYRPRIASPLDRRSLGYTRRRRSRPRGNKAASAPCTVNTEIVSFDHGPVEFPVATVRPREARAQLIALVGALQAWLVARWQWLRPRSVPCAVAGLGMLAVLASADYLAHYKDACMDRHTAAAVHVQLAPPAVTR